MFLVTKDYYLVARKWENGSNNDHIPVQSKYSAILFGLYIPPPPWHSKVA